jgi:predicted methyltransferase
MGVIHLDPFCVFPADGFFQPILANIPGPLGKVRLLMPANYTIHAQETSGNYDISPNSVEIS